MNQTVLSCVGCGNPVAQAAGPGAVLAISCRCGAMAPILYGEGVMAPPASLVLSRGRTPPHSDHESDLKTAFVEALRRMGSISQAECPEQACQEEVRRRERIAEIGEP